MTKWFSTTHLFQNDYVDLFGTSGTDGKERRNDGEDIGKGKVTWFLQHAMIHGNNQQKEIITVSIY